MRCVRLQHEGARQLTQSPPHASGLSSRKSRCRCVCVCVCVCACVCVDELARARERESERREGGRGEDGGRGKGGGREGGRGKGREGGREGGETGASRKARRLEGREPTCIDRTATGSSTTSIRRRPCRSTRPLLLLLRLRLPSPRGQLGATPTSRAERASSSRGR